MSQQCFTREDLVYSEEISKTSGQKVIKILYKDLHPNLTSASPIDNKIPIYVAIKAYFVKGAERPFTWEDTFMFTHKNLPDADLGPSKEYPEAEVKLVWTLIENYKFKSNVNLKDVA